MVVVADVRYQCPQTVGVVVADMGSLGDEEKRRVGATDDAGAGRRLDEVSCGVGAVDERGNGEASRWDDSTTPPVGGGRRGSRRVVAGRIHEGAIMGTRSKVHKLRRVRGGLVFCVDCETFARWLDYDVELANCERHAKERSHLLVLCDDDGYLPIGDEGRKEDARKFIVSVFGE